LEQQREVARNAFNGLEKKHLRASHLSEQRYLCINSRCQPCIFASIGSAGGAEPGNLDHPLPQPSCSGGCAGGDPGRALGSYVSFQIAYLNRDLVTLVA
jgi:hypothetical protein